jgi:hypothetical protein
MLALAFHLTLGSPETLIALWRTDHTYSSR